MNEAGLIHVTPAVRRVLLGQAAVSLEDQCGRATVVVGVAEWVMQRLERGERVTVVLECGSAAVAVDVAVAPIHFDADGGSDDGGEND